MGEMAYVGSSRGSSSLPYSRTAPRLVEEISAEQFSNVRGIEEDLTLIRQGERAQLMPSDEDTEDASETDQQKKEDEYTEMRKQIYRDKLLKLKQQLEQLEQGGLHPDYLRKLKKLETVYKDRLLLNEVWKDYEMQRAEEEYISEKQSAFREMKIKKSSFKRIVFSSWKRRSVT